jgi:hypothetical protein
MDHRALLGELRRLLKRLLVVKQVPMVNKIRLALANLLLGEEEMAAEHLVVEKGEALQLRVVAV